MLGNFTYSNPTKLYFGEGALDNLKAELANYSKNIMLVYGGGSIKKNGIYDKVTAILNDCGKNVFEDSGVMPNPTVEKLYEGCKIAKDNNVDLILAVGAALYAIIPRRCRCLHTARMTRGRNIIFVWRKYITKSFP
mgnify:CR=1 FL=1